MYSAAGLLKALYTTPWQTFSIKHHLNFSGKHSAMLQLIHVGCSYKYPPLHSSNILTKHSVSSTCCCYCSTEPTHLSTLFTCMVCQIHYDNCCVAFVTSYWILCYIKTFRYLSTYKATCYGYYFISFRMCCCS